MKKQMIAIAVLIAAVSLTGCTVNINDETMSAAKDIAASVLDDTDIKVNGQSVDVSLDSDGNVSVNMEQKAAAKPGPDLFGGYVIGDTAVKSQPDSNSETLITIPDATQISVKESGVSGWFMTVFQDQTGYIAAQSVKDIPPYDPALGGDNVLGGSVNADVKLMSGTHPYAEVLIEIPNGTQVNYYAVPDQSGWCAVNYQNEIGYIEAKYISPIEDYVPAEPDVSVLTGEYRYQLRDEKPGEFFIDEGYVTVNADGTYIYQPKDGSLRQNGVVQLEYDEYPDGSRSPLFVFREKESNEVWNGTYDCEPDGKGAFYLGNGGMARLLPKDQREDDFSDYIGIWQYDRCSIQIGGQGEGYLVTIHWADSASEDNVWSYQCSGMSDNMGLECTGGGTLTHIVTAEDGTETRTVVYSDGTAFFRQKDGRLFWSDGKENKGMEMGFEKIG